MLDFRFIKDNLEAVKKNIVDRNMNCDADLVVQLFDKRTELVTSLQALQTKRNDNAKAMKGKLPDDERKRLIEEGKSIKEEISKAEALLNETEAKLDEAARQIPNMAHPEAPVGSLDTENLEVKRVGTPREFSFQPKDHVQLGQDLDIIDFDAGTKVSGPKFYFLKNEAVFLEQALIMYAMNILRKHGFTPFITPDIAREEILQGIGFNPRGNESNVYSLEGENSCLVATAEITLGGYHFSTVDFHIVSVEKQELLVNSQKDCIVYINSPKLKCLFILCQKIQTKSTQNYEKLKKKFLLD